MIVKSLGSRTDLIFHAFDGILTHRGDYLVVRSPLNPSYYWGNFLLFARPPQPGDFDAWRGLFRREIGRPPAVSHQAFSWDTTDGETGVIEPFVQAGFAAELNVVLTSRQPRLPPRASTHVTVRPLRAPSDWEQAIEQQVLSREEGHEEAGYRKFRRDSMDRYRRMEAAGLGHWYGAFLGDRLVGDLGIFHDGRGLGRYQSVATHPDFRRQGIGGAMVYDAGRQAMAEHSLDTLVIVAEADSSPSRLYESAGFSPVEKNVGLLWWDRKPASPSPG